MALDAHVTAHALGDVDIAPFDVVLSDPTIVQPDILFAAADRSAAFSDRGFEGAPTLVVEVLSPSTAHIDRNTKLHRVAAGAYGVPERFGGDILATYHRFQD